MCDAQQLQHLPVNLYRPSPGCEQGGDVGRRGVLQRGCMVALPL